MRPGTALRRYWPETLLALSVALPWLSLIVFGMIWLWQSGYTLVWAIGAAALGLTAWPLRHLVRRRRADELRLALSARSEPSPAWRVREQDAWSDVLAMATATEPFSFVETGVPLAVAEQTIKAVSRRFYPDDSLAWAKFSVPEGLLLLEQASRDLRREMISSIPGARNITLAQALWVKQQYDRYGPLAGLAWRAWRVARFFYNPVQAASNEISAASQGSTMDSVLYRLRTKFTQEFIRAVGRAAIDLYAGHLTLSEGELQVAAAADAPAAEPVVPVRIVLTGQISAGKSSLVNALGQATQAAVGPLPTTSRVAEYRLDLEGRPAVYLADMPGIGDSAAPELQAQIERADLIVWVASATRPARELDRQGLDGYRAWARTQLIRRVPPVILALTHVDELRPASEWLPPYDVAAPERPKARNIRAAMDAVASALDLPVAAVVPVAMPPGSVPYNVDSLWARIAVELDEAKLVQLDRLRIGSQRLNLREVATQFSNAGRFILHTIASVQSE